MSHAHGHAGAAHQSQVRVAAVSLAVTAALLAVKLTLGLISDSIAVLSDAVDSGTDLAAGAAALMSVRIAASPADESHPYGHGKIEAVSAAVAATIIAIGGGFVTYQALHRLLGTQPHIDVGVGLTAMLIAAGANIVMFFFMSRIAKRTDSMALRAESKHLETNVVQAGAIITGLVLVAVTDEQVFDPIVALLLAAYMGWTAIGLVRTALGDIIDRALPEEDLLAIRDVLLAHDEHVRGFHRLRTRRSGATRHVDMHLLFDADLTVEKAHDIADEIDHQIEARLPGTVVVIHIEPDGADAEPLESVTRARDVAGD